MAIYSTDGLLHELCRQYPTWETTWGSCRRECGRTARGGTLCPECCVAELTARKLDVDMLLTLTTLLQHRQSLEGLIDGLTRRLKQQAQR